MESLDLAAILVQELWYQQFVTLDGLNSGVPTRTTPTITPTTLRNIEQTFIELQNEQESHQNEAGFVPPIVPPIAPAGVSSNTLMSLVDQKAWQGGITSVNVPEPRPLSAMPNISCGQVTTRRNMGGRRPNKTAGISEEEEERRRVRRERNKMAAARCRKRRMDHTNALVEETEGLEDKKLSLQKEIQELQIQKEELELLLEAHQPYCHFETGRRSNSPIDIKPIVIEDGEKKFITDPYSKQEILITNPLVKSIMTAPPVPISQPQPAIRSCKPLRPTSLPFAPSQNTFKASVAVSEVAGISITTPSTGIPFNFDSLMEGGTGLTPVTTPLVPSCSSQQRNSGGIDISSPDSVPTNQLVSL